MSRGSTEERKRQGEKELGSSKEMGNGSRNKINLAGCFVTIKDIAFRF